MVKDSYNYNEFHSEDSKQREENDIKNILDKYDDSSFVNPNNNLNINLGLNKGGNKGSIDIDRKSMTSINKRKHKQSEIDINNFNNPSTDINSKNVSELQEETLFDPVTERECSFIENISVDNSNFIADVEKENDVVLCISNLEIENSTLGKKFQSKDNLDKLNNNEVMQSEEKFISEKNKQNKNLISNNTTNTFNFTRKRKLIIILGTGLFLITIFIITMLLKY
jgi:hypothetical protein